MKRINCIFDENENLKIDANDPEYENRCSFNKNSKAKKFIRKFYVAYKFRYLLEYQLNKNKGKDIAVILMNPSYADENYLDNTLYNVKKFIQNLNKKKLFSKFIVLNLFPIRTPNSKNIPELMNGYQEQQEKNDNEIIEILNSTKDVIVAWGKKYHNIAKNKKWFYLLHNKNLYAYDINLENDKKTFGTPKHFSPYAYDYKENDFQNKTLKNYQIELTENGYFKKLH